MSKRGGVGNVRLLARIVIPSEAEPENDAVRSALADVTSSEALIVSIDINGMWSHAAFNRHLGPDFEFDYSYHPYGKIGALASFVAEQLGTIPEFMIKQDHEPGRVY